jgi:NAD(P)-dependent dehydrogenase (short-subunit alcohol dehydrogenase family)
MSVVGKTVLITGATSGLGRGVARELSVQGHTVLVHGRDPGLVDDAITDLGRDARGYVADLSSLNHVRRLADWLNSNEERIDVLVNNAGVATTERQETYDGVEMDFGVNHLSHWLLTGRLLPVLERSAPARIVNVASIGQAPIDWNDPLLERGWESFRAYAQSKLAQINFTMELDERTDSRAVTVNALHPATLMDTRMVRETFGRAQSRVADGVRPVVRLAVGADVNGYGGRYFDQLLESRAHEQAYDRDARRRLWDLSARLAGEDPYG